jgi:hypothetical protein
MLAIGDPERISDEYIRLNFPEGALAPSAAQGEEAPDREAAILDAWFEDGHGRRHEYLPQRGPCSFRALVEFRAHADDPPFTLMIRDDERRNVFGTSTTWAQEETGNFAPGDRALFGVNFENLLAPGRYHAMVSVARRGGGQALLTKRDRAASFVSTGTRASEGIVELPHDLEVKKHGSAPPAYSAAEETRA